MAHIVWYLLASLVCLSVAVFLGVTDIGQQFPLVIWILIILFCTLGAVAPFAFRTMVEEE